MLNILSVVLMLFFLSIAGFGAYFAFDTMITEMRETEVFGDNNMSDQALSDTSAVANKYDMAFFGVFIGVILAMAVLGYMIGGNVLLMVIYFIVQVVLVILSVVMGHVWERMTSASIWGTTISSFPITNHILGHFPVYMAIMSGIAILAMLIKPITQPQ